LSKVRAFLPSNASRSFTLFTISKPRSKLVNAKHKILLTIQRYIGFIIKTYLIYNTYFLENRLCLRGKVRDLFLDAGRKGKGVGIPLPTIEVNFSREE